MKTIRTLFVLLSLLFSTFVFATPVNINTAEAQVLAKNIKGIGIKKAEAIVAYREAHGEFKSSSDIMKVKGIGKRMYEKIQDLIVVEDAVSEK